MIRRPRLVTSEHLAHWSRVRLRVFLHPKDKRTETVYVRILPPYRSVPSSGKTVRGEVSIRPARLLVWDGAWHNALLGNLSRAGAKIKTVLPLILGDRLQLHCGSICIDTRYFGSAAMPLELSLQVRSATTNWPNRYREPRPSPIGARAERPSDRRSIPNSWRHGRSARRPVSPTRELE